MIVDLAWPFVALVAIGVAAYFASAMLLSKNTTHVVLAKVNALATEVARVRSAQEHTQQSLHDAQGRWMAVEKRVESFELRKLGGMR